MSLASTTYNLLDDGDVLWGSRVFPIQRPEGQGTPALTYEISDNEQVTSHVAPTKNFEKSTVTVTAYAALYSTAVDCSEAIRSLVDRASQDDYVFVYQNSSDIVSVPLDGSDRPVYMVNLDFLAMKSC